MDNTSLSAPGSHKRETDPGDDLASLSCLDALRRSKIIRWGIRKRVTHLARKVKEVKPRMSLIGESVSESKVGGSSKQAMAESKVKEELKQLSGGKRKREGSSCSNKMKPTKILQTRWSVERCEAAKKALLGVVREMGATWHKPVIRHHLRENARKHIGDTGLLDHLLKHMAGEVLADGNDRLVRRHNTEGAIEYWLEPAELAMLRREAGITDPYWVPPPGWKLGDPISDRKCDGQCKAMISQCKEEIMNLLKIEIAEVMNSMMKTVNAQQEKYLDLQAQHEKLLDQVTSMKDEYQSLHMQYENMNQQVVSMKEKYLHFQVQHEKLQDQVISMQEKEKGKQVVTGAEAGTKEKTATKSGLSICQPEGTFVWPNMVNAGGQYSPHSVSSDVSLPPKHIVLPSPTSPLAPPRPAFFCQQQPDHGHRSIPSFSLPHSLVALGQSPTQSMIHRPTPRYPLEGKKRSGASTQMVCNAMASAKPRINSDKNTGDIATDLTLASLKY